MDTPTDNPAAVRPPVRGVAVASVALGFFSLLVFWWFPFGFMLGMAGFTIGLVCTLFGLRGGMKGENLALIGMGLSGTTMVVCYTLFVIVPNLLSTN